VSAVTDDNPYRANRGGQPKHFHVVVQGVDEYQRATRQVIAKVASESAAFKRLVEVLLQWEASHGAIRPGTKVSIVHATDGGKVFQMEYLGYQETLI
jgi:hypothetical protein